MRRWIQVCGGPAVLAVVGVLLLALVEHLEHGTYLERYRLGVLYASQAAFLFGIVWTLRNLWGQLKEYLAR